jgi:tetratricopeptide (TPR) repeat protein
VFSHDLGAPLVLAGYGDGSARLFDGATQKPLGPQVEHGHWIAGATFAPDDRSFITTRYDGSSRRWPVPATLDGDLERLALRLQVHTGLVIGDGQSVVQLDSQRWQERRAQLAARKEGGGSGVSDADLHDARARDAEQDNDMFAARWHLDRLIALDSAGPNGGWLAYARRARIWSSQHAFDKADADYADARRRGAPDQLLGWYRDRIMDCLTSKNVLTARWYLDRAIALAPDDWQLYADRAHALDQLGKPGEREADLARAAERGAESWFLVSLADEYARRGLWEKSSTTYALAFDRGRCISTIWRQAALALLKRSDRAGYRKFCERMVQNEGAPKSANDANNLAWICALGPNALDDYKTPVALAEKVVKLASPNGKHGALNTLGAILLRAGRAKEAIERLDEGIKANKGEGHQLDWLFLAMAHHRVGATAQARRCLDRVNACPPQSALSWDCLEIELLHKEVRAMFEEKAAPAPQ